jgi:putative ATP-binding cassette transporter
MKLIELLKREIPNPSPLLFVFSALSGISNACLIAVINGAAESVSNKSINWQYTILYVLCASVFFYSKKYTLDRSSELVEWVINRVRRRLADKVRHTELVSLDKYGTATIYARISQDATIISNVTTNIINSVQSSIMIIFTLLYVAWISTWSFGLISAGLGLGVFHYMGYSERFQNMWRTVSLKETIFYEKLNHILKGFKEIRINRRKNEEVFRNYEEINDATRDYRVQTSQQYNRILIFTQVFFYIMLGVILFVLPKLHIEYAGSIIKVVTSFLFISGPLEGIIYAIPSFSNANNAANNLILLEQQLEEELKKLGEDRLSPHDALSYECLPFERCLELRDVRYQYAPRNGNEARFQIGPFNLKIQKGELIFITGGNGSGKSTFMHLITGLYKPNSGSISLDSEEGRGGILVNQQNYQCYQNLFSIIFSDYHLFDKIYGIEQTLDAEEVNRLMQKLGLPHEKVKYQSGGFTNTHLSSGQKKRLALVTSILEDKSIYIYDEVAADLDPEFRDQFYFVILPELKRRNKTVLVVSHDQQYWLVPDRLLHFQDGVMHELTRSEVATLISVGKQEQP